MFVQFYFHSSSSFCARFFFKQNLLSVSSPANDKIAYFIAFKRYKTLWMIAIKISLSGAGKRETFHSRNSFKALSVSYLKCRRIICLALLSKLCRHSPPHTLSMYSFLFFYSNIKTRTRARPIMSQDISTSRFRKFIMY